MLTDADVTAKNFFRSHRCRKSLEATSCARSLPWFAKAILHDTALPMIEILGHLHTIICYESHAYFKKNAVERVCVNHHVIRHFFMNSVAALKAVRT